jgi:hypothetical protein
LLKETKTQNLSYGYRKNLCIKDLESENIIFLYSVILINRYILQLKSGYIS